MIKINNIINTDIVKSKRIIIKNPIKYIKEYNSFWIGEDLSVLVERVTEKKNNKKALNNCIGLCVVITFISLWGNNPLPI